MSKPLLIAFCGKAGSGKDTSADYLVHEQRFVKIAFADPMKRFCREVFDFSEKQLWGPSSARNAPDERYPRVRRRLVAGFTDKYEEYTLNYLTPREALQQLGTQWGRSCHPDTWVSYALRVAKKIIDAGDYSNLYYSAEIGLWAGVNNVQSGRGGVVISDCRFLNELKLVKAAGGRVIKLLRDEGALTGVAGAHESEMEMEKIPIEFFDAVIPNYGSVRDLQEQVTDIIATFKDTP